jgi:DNA mismatch endonuclease, patch repair protein
VPDIVSPEVRSRMMSGIRGKDTKPEIVIRKALHQQGFRYRLYDKNLPGKPDMVFAGRRAVILVHGCFWHGHDCHLFKWPSSRPEWWRAKIEANWQRDTVVMQALQTANWRVLTIWECAVKGKHRHPVETVATRAALWLDSGNGNLEIRGTA